MNIIWPLHIFRLESEYDNLEEPNSDSTRAPPEVSLSPDSDNGDIYENLPTVIKQGQQVHSDGLTMQSINIQGPKARFDGSFDGSSAPNQSWDMLQGSLNFAYGPPASQEKEKDPKEDTSDYTSLKELAPAKPVHPVVPARTVSTVKNSGSQHSLLAGASQLVATDANRFQTDVWDWKNKRLNHWTVCCDRDEGLRPDGVDVTWLVTSYWLTDCWERERERGTWKR